LPKEKKEGVSGLLIRRVKAKKVPGNCLQEESGKGRILLEAFSDSILTAYSAGQGIKKKETCQGKWSLRDMAKKKHSVGGEKPSEKI